MAERAWERVALPDVIDYREGPGIMARDFRESGTPLIRLAGLSGGSLLQGCNWLDPEVVNQKWKHFRVERGDVLLSTSASLGRVAIVDQEAIGAIPYTGIVRMRPRDGRLTPDFLPWVLRAPDFADQVRAMGVGSVMNHFGPSHLRQMTVVIPGAELQRRIAGVLGAFDDLIDTDTRIAHEADSCAAAWWEFVLHDEPRDVPVGTLATVVLGGTPSRSKSSLWGGTVPWINSGEANKFRILHASEMITEEGLERSSTKMMPAGATVVAITGATLGQVSRLGISACGNQSLVGVFTQDEATNDHLFFAIRNSIPGLVASATGGAQQHINKGNVEELLVSLPNPELLRSWHEIARPLLDASSEMLREADELARVRDELLPLLMSGRITVDEAWEAVP